MPFVDCVVQSMTLSVILDGNILGSPHLHQHSLSDYVSPYMCV